MKISKSAKRSPCRTTVTILYVSFLFLSLCSDEGVFIDTNGAAFKDVIVQWGELPTSVGKCLEEK